MFTLTTLPRHQTSPVFSYLGTNLLRSAPSWTRPAISAPPSRPVYLQPSPVHAEPTEAPGLVLPEQISTVVQTFRSVPDPKLKYQQLLFLAKGLPALPAADHVPENKVLGCTSQVWVTAHYKDGKMLFAADSDSELTKGLAALLIKCLSGLTPQEVLLLDPAFLGQFGMQGSVTPSRINGFLNMFKTMQRKTLEAVKAAG
eukprot:EG_transcript_23255